MPMNRILLQILLLVLKSMGILAVFTGLSLAAAQYFFWGVFLFVTGLALLGLHEEGWKT